VAQDLATGERKVLLREGVDARYVRSGHVVFMRQGVIMAATLDPDGLTVRGEPAPVLEGVGHALTAGNSGDVTGAGQFAVATSGTLAYVAGPVQPYPQRTLVAVDRAGRVSPLATPTRSYTPSLSLAPDGRRLAVVSQDIREMALWIVDTSRKTLTRLAGGGEFVFPRWTPDGQHVAFSRRANGVSELVWQRADGTGAAEPLVRGAHRPSSWSPDGQYLATLLDGDIWIVTVAGSTSTLERLTETPEGERWPEFSPDGRWLAYASKTTGRSEIYIRPWPGPGPREQISLEGGESPAWNPRGHELFYLSPTDAAGRARMVVVQVETSPRLRIGVPQFLFDFSGTELWMSCIPVRCYAVSPDGGRFFTTQPQPLAPTPPVTQIRIVQGWIEEMKARVGETTR
jgi:dipeptidyl aminopeptidase/acylaminoacyl peptidase